MKTLFLLILCLLQALYSIEAPAQVFWKHTTTSMWGYDPDTGDMDSAYCFTALSCFGDNCTAAGRAQRPGNPKGLSLIFFRSTDGGKSWFEQVANVNYHWQVLNSAFRKIQQIDSLNVIAMARKGGTIVRTNDGGVTWFNIDCPVERELLDIHFSDPLNGVLTCVGLDSNLYTTSDGGVNWINRPFIPVYSCHTYGPGKYRFFKYGHGPFYTTYDDFATIDSTPPLFDASSDSLYQYVFAFIGYGTKDTMFAMANYFDKDSTGTVRPHGLIMRTTDGGKTWEKPWIFPWTKLAYLRHITSLVRDTIYAAGGDHRHYIYSVDRGKTWTLDSINIDIDHETGTCYGIAVVNDGHTIASFGSPGTPLESVLARGEFGPLKVEYIELIKYYSYFYPNPTNGKVQISSLLPYLPVAVVDIFGREVVRGLHLSAEGKCALDLSLLPPGIYNVILDYRGRKFIAGKIALIE